MAEEGFVHKGRRVYAILYRLECPPPQIMELVVQLDSDGNGIGGDCRPVDPSKRMVQVHPGEKIISQGQEFTVTAVEVFRSLPLA